MESTDHGRERSRICTGNFGDALDLAVDVVTLSSVIVAPNSPSREVAFRRVSASDRIQDCDRSDLEQLNGLLGTVLRNQRSQLVAILCEALAILNVNLLALLWSAELIPVNSARNKISEHVSS